MAGGLILLSPARSIVALIAYVTLGVAIYLAAAALLYMPWLLRTLGGRSKLSAAE